MDTLFKTSNTFASLSLKDLIEARDLFHYNLINKKNVVATALGLYRIRRGDPWPSRENPNPKAPPESKRERRTLANSDVRPYSWPCIYVFVSSWEHELELAATDPSDVVPKTLFLPDGRAVPVCVIEARQQPWSKDLQVNARGLTPRNLLAPGVALVNEDGQGMARVATAGCIVRDGQRYYALTNRHAVGAPGTPIEALQVHRRVTVGTSAEKGLTRQDFRAVYPHFQGASQRLLMDIGLVDLDDVLQWKTRVPGISPVGPVLDLYDNSLTLKLVTMKVVGQSAVSGLIRGEIHGLFYRYKSMGGSEYVSDFLIGPETYGPRADGAGQAAGRDADAAFSVHHGDSGTLLFIEHQEAAADGEDGGDAPARTYYPFALLWGREEFFDDGRLSSHPYALATSLSTALDRLDLDLVTDLNSDQLYIWGWVGHYVIGRALGVPTDLVRSEKLRAFIDKNKDLLAVQPGAALDNDPKVGAGEGGGPGFIPLADVPDNVWKSNVNFTLVPGDDGKKHHQPGTGSRGRDDNPNHFADLDMEYEDGKTFLELNAEDPDKYLNPPAWIEYFAAAKPQFDAWADLLAKEGQKGKRDNHWGALPFRVHQLFDIMVAAAKAGDAKLFLCAGGVLIHYVGDACQPLHASYLSQGDPARVVPRSTGTMKLEADGVHSGYEDEMVAYGYQEQDLDAKLRVRIRDLSAEASPGIASGYDASKAIIALITATQKEIAPRDIVDTWVTLNGTPRKAKAAAMWQKFGDDTITCMARGTRYLAKIWQAAWEVGGGEDDRFDAGERIDEADMMSLYNDPKVAPSIPLNRYPDTSDSDWSALTRA